MRLLRGWGLSLVVGLGAGGGALLLGTVLGLVASSAPKWVEEFILLLVQSLWVIPAVLWATALAFVLGKSFIGVVGAIILSTWTDTARLVRVESRRLWHMPYMDAARSLGLPFLSIVKRHLLPNLMPLLQTQFLQSFATAVFVEAGLGFVGLGLGPPYASLGALLFEALGWLTLPQGQLQGGLAALLLCGTVFASYWAIRMKRNSIE
ncbi:MAG: ABC transporter permease subunit [Bacteroidia bacterium]|nr:ABC transporter permease subunit [Bacteroidia bacterium]